MKVYYSVDNVTYLRTKSYARILITGWALQKNGRPVEKRILINGKPCACREKSVKREDVLSQMNGYKGGPEVGFVLSAAFPLELDLRTVRVEAGSGVFRQTMKEITAEELNQDVRTNRFRFAVDRTDVNHAIREASVTGWGLSAGGRMLDLRVEDDAGNEVPFRLIRHNRYDLYFNHFTGDEINYGEFVVKFPFEEGRKYYMAAEHKGEYLTVPVDIGPAPEEVPAEEGTSEADASEIKASAGEAPQLPGTVDDYDRWYRRHRISEESLNGQRETAWERKPLVSVVMPVYEADPEFLKEAVGSLKAQTYGNWELCVSDSSQDRPDLKDLITSLAEEDGRIRAVFQDRRMQISENTNAAIGLASGDYILFMDQDDLLEPHALFMCMQAVSENRGADLIYSDEDKYDSASGRFFEPYFKSDYCEELIRNGNHIGHLCMVSRALLEKVNGLDPETDGAQDYDFVLRCLLHTEDVVHIPEVLYHWRAHSGSTAADTGQKLYAYENGVRALSAYYREKGIDAKVSIPEKNRKTFYGYYKTDYPCPEHAGLTVIVISKGKTDALKRFNASAKAYQNYPETEYLFADDFEAAAEAAMNASGEYLLFADPGIHFKQENNVGELLKLAGRKDVGAVSPFLLYQDHTVRSAGVVWNRRRNPGYVFHGQLVDDGGYMRRMLTVMEYRTALPECFMIRKDVYEAAGGLDTGWSYPAAVADLCLRLKEKGLRNLVTPYAEMFYFGGPVSAEGVIEKKVPAFADEEELKRFEAKYPELFTGEDPFYSCRFSHDDAGFAYLEE